MNSKNRNLFIIFCFFVLITACSSGPSIQSAKEDQVIISASPKSFVEAYGMAQKECSKNDKSASYIAEPSSSLKKVAFSCVGQKVEPVAETQTEVETTAEEETTQ